MPSSGFSPLPTPASSLPLLPAVPAVPGCTLEPVFKNPCTRRPAFSPTAAFFPRGPAPSLARWCHPLVCSTAPLPVPERPSSGARHSRRWPPVCLHLHTALSAPLHGEGARPGMSWVAGAPLSPNPSFSSTQRFFACTHTQTGGTPNRCPPRFRQLQAAAAAPSPPYFFLTFFLLLKSSSLHIFTGVCSPLQIAACTTRGTERAACQGGAGEGGQLRKEWKTVELLAHAT